MNGWLLLFLVPLGTATRVSLFDDNDDDRNADSDGGEGGGEDGGDQVPVADNLDGALAGTEGDDTITATRDEVGATAEPNETEGFSWDYSGNDEIWDWDTRSDYPGDEPLPGLAVVDAGAGNDDITSGLSTHVDAGTGNDTTSVDTTGAAEGTFRDPAATLEAGDGDDDVTAIGAGIGIRTAAATMRLRQAAAAWISMAARAPTRSISRDCRTARSI